MDKKSKSKYCFDTDTLASSWRLHYRPDSFGPLWETLGALVKNRTILIPEEVRKEVGAGNDPLVVWLRKYDTVGTPITKEQLEIVAEIVNKFPRVSRYKKPRPNHADPFVVAVAKLHQCTVVTFENPNGSPLNPAIPDLCKLYGVDRCSMSDFFVKEGWKFNINR